MKRYWILFFVGLILVSCASLRTKEVRLVDMLLTKDYGILKSSDYEYYYDTYSIADPIEGKSVGFYWACFHTDQFRMHCNEAIPGKDEFGEELTSDLIIQSAADGIRYEYGYSHLYPVEKCLNDRDEIKKILKGQKYVCIGGEEANAPGSDLNRERHFVYRVIQTKDACQSWFLNACRDADEFKAH